MSLLALRTAIVAGITTGETAFNVVKSHGGIFNRAEYKRIAVKTPGCSVAIFGGPVTRNGKIGVCMARVVAFIVAKGTSETKRDVEAMVLAESVANLAAADAWGYEAKAPEEIGLANLYSGDIDRDTIAIWSVTWQQLVDLSDFDLSTLDDFYKAHVDWDLAPRDGVVDAQQVISLGGDFMSIYGHIYISAAAATGIAVAGTYQKALGATTLKLADDCDMPADGRVRHIGTVSKPMLATATGSVSVAADAKVTLAISKNGTVDENTAQEIECTLAEGAEPFSLTGLFNLDENDYVDIWITADDTVAVTLTLANTVLAGT